MTENFTPKMDFFAKKFFKNPQSTQRKQEILRVDILSRFSVYTQQQKMLLIKKTKQMQFMTSTNQNENNYPDLLRKEMDVNQAEQVLLQQRIALAKNLINDLPSSDPRYSSLLTQTQMDQIEIDELKKRRDAIQEQLKAVE